MDTIVLISILFKLLRFTEFIVMISAANNVPIGASLKFSKYKQHFSEFDMITDGIDDFFPVCRNMTGEV